jgi:hypothetical protein
VSEPRAILQLGVARGFAINTPVARRKSEASGSAAETDCALSQDVDSAGLVGPMSGED